MQIVQIDHIDAQALQRQITTATRVFGTAIDGPVLVGRPCHNAKFCSQGHSLAAASEGFADLVLGIAIDVGRVEEIDTQVQGAMDELDGIGLGLHTAGVNVSDADTHATKSNGGNFEAGSAESAFFHTTTL
jgi:hypothetical protein